MTTAQENLLATIKNHLAKAGTDDFLWVNTNAGAYLISGNVTVTEAGHRYVVTGDHQTDLQGNCATPRKGLLKSGVLVNGTRINRDFVMLKLG